MHDSTPDPAAERATERPASDLIYRVEGAIAEIRLNRPAARNAYSEAMIAALLDALDDAATTPSVRCVVLTGEGKAFCAGGDLKRMQARTGMFAGDSATLRDRYIALIQQIPRRLARFDVPIVAAVNGAAIGAGLDLACMCDVRIASSRAKFGSTFVKVGLVPGDGGAYLLGRTIGLPRALELIMTGRIIDVVEAERIGLVHAVVEPADLRAAAWAKAEAIAANPPIAVRLAKRAAYRSWDADLEMALELAATYQGITQRTADHAEAVDAFLEKRAPRFEGR